MAKKVLPGRLHKIFEQVNWAGDVPAMKAMFEEENLDINATLFKIQPNPTHDNHYEFYLFNRIFEGANIIEKLDFFLANGININLTGYNGESALFLKCKPENYPVLVKLLENNITINHKDYDGANYIHHLVREYGDPIDLDNYSDIRIKNRPPEMFKTYLLFIETLLKSGADTSLKNKYETSALHWMKHRKETGNDKWNEKLETLINTYARK